MMGRLESLFSTLVHCWVCWVWCWLVWEDSTFFAEAVHTDSSAAQRLYTQQQLLSRFRSSAEHATATAEHLYSQSLANQGVSTTTGLLPPLSQQCCRICGTEEDIGMGVTVFVEEGRQAFFKSTGKRATAKTFQPDQCNTSWVNYQLFVVILFACRLPS